MIHNAVFVLSNEAWKGASRQLAKQSMAESLRQADVDTAVWCTVSEASSSDSACADESSLDPSMATDRMLHEAYDCRVWMPGVLSVRLSVGGVFIMGGDDHRAGGRGRAGRRAGGRAGEGLV